jgi:hypothetical protein
MTSISLCWTAEALFFFAEKPPLWIVVHFSLKGSRSGNAYFLAAVQA